MTVSFPYSEFDSPAKIGCSHVLLFFIRRLFEDMETTGTVTDDNTMILPHLLYLNISNWYKIGVSPYNTFLFQ